MTTYAIVITTILSVVCLFGAEICGSASELLGKIF